jgi:hypothetical protein
MSSRRQIAAGAQVRADGSSWTVLDVDTTRHHPFLCQLSQGSRVLRRFTARQISYTAPAQLTLDIDDYPSHREMRGRQQM